MRKRSFVMLARLVSFIFVLICTGYCAAAMPPGEAAAPQDNAQAVPAAPATVCNGKMRCMTNDMRKAAAARAAAARPASRKSLASGAKATAAATAPTPTPGGMPDYFGPYPNYANSPLPAVVNGVVQPGTGIRKFVDSLPGLGPQNANNLGNYIPIATPIANPLYPNDDYYEIGVFDYNWNFHSDLKALNPAGTKVRGYKDLNPNPNPLFNVAGTIGYLGPVIVAQRDKAVRVKFTNGLGLGAAGNLFIPVDPTAMGAGMGPLGGSELYTENRATLHLHGGNTPWISDGTPHQWITPAGESTNYKKGLSFQNVPDMVGAGKTIPNPTGGDGLATFYWTNQQSSRLMFYHDHSYGTTRLNVYAGEAAGYLLYDQVEKDLIEGTNVSGSNPTSAKVLPDLGGVYHFGVPLIIQDKTFVPDTTKPFTNTLGTFPSQLAQQDPTWDTTKWGGTGNLWFPHVYMTNQDPGDSQGANAMGRWDYGPWFWPPLTPELMNNGPIANPYYNAANPALTPEEAPVIPGMGATPSMVPEAFMDTPVVNGAAYPYMAVKPQAYRFRILNACNDRTLNLQLYYADSNNPTEVKMVPAVPASGLPPTWPADGRDGGVPDPATVGPPIIQIGTEGGLLPAPVVIPATPIGYEYGRRSITVLNVSTHALLIGPAERADIIVDFSSVPSGSTLILYNDAPAPVPAFDSRYDYYTGDPDQTSTGGAPTTMPGYGPNIRTIMQFRVSGTKGASVDLNALNTALPRAYSASQPAPIVPEAAYGQGYGTTFPDSYSAISDTSLTFTDIGDTQPSAHPMLSKTIQELFELNYGRMNATLGVELPLTNFNTQTTIPLGYTDPVTETINNGETQIWKITHNGVDTHFIHFHLFNVQVINRVGWDGMVKPPDANELGWKDTVRMNPLEDAIVALKPIVPSVPFAVPDSIRPEDVTTAVGSPIKVTDIAPANIGNTITINNPLINFGWEYVWHCHILGHEENDMMRPIAVTVPSSLNAEMSNPWPGTSLASGPVTFTWGPGVGLAASNQYQLMIGTTGAGSSNVYPSTVLSTTSVTVSNLPAGGVTLYVRLGSLIGGSWQYEDYTYTAAKTATTTVLTSSANPAATGADVKLTATVSPAPTGAAMGTLQFQEGGVVLGTCDFAATLPNCAVTGAAVTLTTNALIPGTHNIVAGYSGNASLAASTSAALTQIIADAAPDFSLSVNPPSGSGTVAVGGTSHFAVTLTPINGYSNTVTFTCNTFKPGLTCDVLPGVAIPNGQPLSVTLSVSASATVSAVHPPARPNAGTKVLWASLGGFGIFGFVLLGATAKNRKRNLIIIGVLAVIVIIAMAGCGGGGSNQSTATPTQAPPSPLLGPQTVMLRATGAGSSTVTHDLTITFTVQ